MKPEPTIEELQVIRSLVRLSRRWPASLWIFAADGDFHVMRAGDDGEHIKNGEGNDPAYRLATIKIPSDGGAW